MRRAEISITPDLSGYVLAGGKSSRMGSDKALIELAGKPLIEHAVTKLRRLTPHVRILSGNGALGGYAPLVRDLHAETGPIGGIEAALADAPTEWSLILPVDVPFLPTLFLAWWVHATAARRAKRMRVSLFRVDGLPQPTLLLIHREVAPFLTEAIARGEYKLRPALERAAAELAPTHAPVFERVPYLLPVDETMQFSDRIVPGDGTQAWQTLTAAQRAAQAMWFANLNTPEELAEAERHVDALDT